MGTLEYSGDVFKAMKAEMDGCIYANLTVTCFMGSSYQLSTDYYVVKSGTVYFVSNNNQLYPSRDTLLSIKTECTKIGIYDSENNKYLPTRKDISFKKLHKMFQP